MDIRIPIGVQFTSLKCNRGFSGCRRINFVNWYHCNLKKTENDADSRESTRVQTSCVWESGPQNFGQQSKPHIVTLLQEIEPQSQKSAP